LIINDVLSHYHNPLYPSVSHNYYEPLLFH
jgi:hypothetical protein